MMQLLPTFCLLVFLSTLELLLASPTASLLPLKRQKKTLQDDLAYLLPEKPVTSFRQRHQEVATKHKKGNPALPPSIFSERQRFIEAKNAAEERHRKRTSEPHMASQLSDQYSQPGYVSYESHLDPWFPALDVQKKLDPRNSNRDSIDAALKHMAWERLNKRLIKLHGSQGPYLDRGERRLRIKKRTPKNVESKKVLEAILSDDPDDADAHAKLENETNPKTGTDKSKLSKNGTKLSDAGKTLPKSTEKSSGGITAPPKKGREPKGKQWMPVDSEHTLRSKKSWDEYFGVDKRSPPSYFPKQDNGANEEDDANDWIYSYGPVNEINEMSGLENEQELKDYLVQWYFDKMLKQYVPQEEESVEKRKKKKSIEVIEISEGHDDFPENDSFGEGMPFEEVDGRLRKVEDAILLEATRLLEKEAEADRNGLGEETGSEIEKGVVDHLKAAFSLEKMRDALEEFQESFNKIKLQEKLQHDLIEEMSKDTLDTLKKKKFGFQSDELEGNEEEDDEVEDKKKKKKSNGVKKLAKKTLTIGTMDNQPQSITKTDLTNEVAVPVFTPESQTEQYLPCPVMTDALGYCEELSEALGEMGRVLARPCVEHMLCYTCDRRPTMCDVGFLQDATLICEEDFRCQAIAGAMRSVFLTNHDAFRRRNRDLCEMDQCLLKLRGIK